MTENFDELHLIKNNFYVGNYNLVINDSTTPSSLQARLQMKCMVYRSQLALKQYQFVIDDIKDNYPEELLAIRLLAQYLLAKSTNNIKEIENCLINVDNVLKTNINPEVILMLATIYNNEDMTNESLKILEKVKSKHLECTCLYIQILLKINRTDLAQKEVTEMKSWADDAVLAQLAETWLNLSMGGDRKYQEAFYIFEELSQSISSVSPKLMTGKAICKMHALNFAEAEKLLIEALKINSTDSDTLVNLIVCSISLGKPFEIINSYLSRLQEIDPNHQYLKEFEQKQTLFDNAAKRYTE